MFSSANVLWSGDKKVDEDMGSTGWGHGMGWMRRK